MYVRLKWKKVIVAIIIEYVWICLNNMILNVAGILIMPKFWIWQSSEYGRVLSMRALPSVHMPKCVLLESWVYLGFYICQDSEYGRVLNMRVTQGSKYVTIWLNMSEYVWIYHNRRGAKYVSNNRKCEVFLQVNEY